MTSISDYYKIEDECYIFRTDVALNTLVIYNHRPYEPGTIIYDGALTELYDYDNGDTKDFITAAHNLYKYKQLNSLQIETTNKVNKMHTPKIEDPKEAFELAIKEQRLSDNEKDDNFAGNYMWMVEEYAGYDYNGDKMYTSLFKNILTRKYLED